MTIQELVNKAHQTAVKHGFWDEWNKIDSNIHDKSFAAWQKKIAIGNMLMLIASELGEAVEALRHDDWDNFTEELADVAIRLGDLAGGLGIDLEWAIEEKMKYNEKRPYKHGKEF
jgi:NTP pyrophosphatase (non-canonical NTP hydrolase)